MKNGTVDQKMGERYHQLLCLELDKNSKENVLAAIGVIEERDDVYYVGPDYKINLDEENQNELIYDEEKTNNSYLSRLSQTRSMALMSPILPNDPKLSKQWAIDKIKLPLAWNYTTGSNQVVVGVIDSGIDHTHPELAGKVDTSLSYDFVHSTSSMPALRDLNHHGTMVAGIIGAETDNNVGMAGVCWNIKLASLRILDYGNRGDYDDAARAINYAGEKNIPILNMSFGDYETSLDLEVAIKNYDGLMICAAGNDGTDNDIMPSYPSEYNYLDNVISVGASDENDNQCVRTNGSSNYGKSSVDLFAPENNIYTTLKGNDYTDLILYWGTSFAAPYVTGVAALMLSENPKATAWQIKNAIIYGVDKIDSLSGLCGTGGRLNAYEALRRIHIAHDFGVGYEWYSNEKHISYCICGGFCYEEHSAYASTVTEKDGCTYAICMSCKEEVNLDEDYIPIIEDW